MASSLAKEAKDVSIVGFHKACSNEGSRKNECGNSELLTEGRVFLKEPIYYGCG